MIHELSYHQAKTILLSAITDLVTPSPAGPVKKVHRGHFSLLESENQTLFCFYAGSEDNPEASNEITLPGTWSFSVAGVAQKIPSTYSGSGEQEAEELASLTLGAWIDAFRQEPDLGLDDNLDATITSIRASDADEYGNYFADVNGVPLWVEGLTVRIDLV
jgi:hypothetical protein